MSDYLDPGLLGLKIGIGSSKDDVLEVYEPADKDRLNRRHFKRGLTIDFDKSDKVATIRLNPFKENEEIIIPSVNLTKIRSSLGKEDQLRYVWHYGGLVEEYIWYRDGYELCLCVVASESYESAGLDKFSLKKGDITDVTLNKSLSSKEREVNEKFAVNFYANFDVYYKYSGYYGGYIYRNRDIIKILDKNEEAKFMPENNEILYYQKVPIIDAWQRGKKSNMTKLIDLIFRKYNAKTYLRYQGHIYYTKLERLISRLDHHENCISEMSLWKDGRRLSNFLLYHYEGNYNNAVISSNPFDTKAVVWIYDNENFVIKSRPPDKPYYAVWDTQFLINGEVYNSDRLEHITSLFLIIENKKIRYVFSSNSVWGGRGSNYIHDFEDNTKYLLYVGGFPYQVKRKR